MRAGVIVSINVGQPREVPWRGETVRTSIFKSPVEGRVWARRLNIEGDAQADLRGHGGEQRAIMVYQMESYRFWAEKLARSDFVMGQFGENLTVDGLSDAEVCVGDRFRIGDALVEVSQPRVTCFKVGLRMNNPQMPALLVAHGRPGFYLRVLEEGRIAAGEAIEWVSRHPARRSVAAVDRLLYGAEHPQAELEQTLTISALSEGWRRSFEALLEAEKAGRTGGNAGLTSGAPPPAWQGFRPLVVSGVHQESEDVRSFVLSDPSGSPLAPARPGQHIAVRLRPPGERRVFRSYSLCGGAEGAFRIAVRRQPDGVASGFLHDHVLCGDTIEASAPRGEFLLEAGATPIVLISAGVGVTPMLAMLRAAVAPGAPERSVWWLHAARDRAHHSFAEEVRALAKGHPQVQVRTIFSRPEPSDIPGEDFDLSGHLDGAKIAQLGPPQDATFYVCGPTAFMDAVGDALCAWGAPSTAIRREAFGAELVRSGAGVPPILSGEAQGGAPTVTFLRSGLSAPWNDRFASLLDLAEACGVRVRWSCRSGVCHSCEAGLVNGEYAYAPNPIDPPENGALLICCATPRSDIELDL